MGRSLLLGLSTSMLIAAALASRAARAEDEGRGTILLVRASGSSGSVETVHGSLPPAGVERRSGRELNGGTIARASLQAELARGIGRFLQQVHAAAVLSHGRFVGWRVTSLFAARSDVHVALLQAGDTVTRVNGRSIERPEAFKQVWDSLAKARELVLDIERAGVPLRLRYAIE